MWIMVVYILIVLVGETITGCDWPGAGSDFSVRQPHGFLDAVLRHPLARVGPRSTSDGTQEREDRKARLKSLHESDARRRVHRYSSPLSMKLGLAPRSNTLLDFKKLNEGATRHSQFHCETSLMKPAGERFE